MIRRPQKAVVRPNCISVTTRDVAARVDALRKGAITEEGATRARNFKCLDSPVGPSTTQPDDRLTVTLPIAYTSLRTTTSPSIPIVKRPRLFGSGTFVG